MDKSFRHYEKEAKKKIEKNHLSLRKISTAQKYELRDSFPTSAENTKKNIIHRGGPKKKTNTENWWL